MLNKLFKYELKSTVRLFLPVYSIIIAFSVILKLFRELSEKLNIRIIPDALSLSLYVIMVIGMFVFTTVVSIRRFYINLIGDEGYLMLTLPAEMSHHILVKTAISVMWTLFSVITALLSVMIIAFYGNILNDISLFLSNAYDSMKMQFNINIYLLALQTLGNVILTLAANYLMIYFALSIGQLFRSNRVLSSIGAYFVLYIINQILTVIFLAVVSTVNKTFWSRILNNDLLAISSRILIIQAAASSVLICLYFISSTYILKNRLNLE